MRLPLKLFTLFLAFSCVFSTFAAGKASHVLLVVWDGMRPDFVSSNTTPVLAHLAGQGTFFSRHHPVYVSSTEVNGTALATGVYPELSGVIGNNEFRPDLDPRRKIMTADPAVLLKRPEPHPYLAYPTVAETLRRSGRPTAVVGAKPVALLADRAPQTGTLPGICVYEKNILPPTQQNLLEPLGAYPAAAVPKTARDNWARQALLGPLWQGGLPAFSLLWLSEPDASQHATGPGSATSLAAIKGSDANLGAVLAELDRRALRDKTDIIVVSDHGFSTILQTIDVPGLLKAAGFPALQELPPQGAQPGDILVVGNGGTVFLYVQQHVPAMITRTVRWLQTQPFCGVIFTRSPQPGTFSLAQGHLQSPDAPDIAFSMAWTADTNSAGTPGLIYSASPEYNPGQGMHGSLSPFDLHNTCVAAGPDFARGFRDELPSGNIDIAPTVLWLLGVPPAKPLSGRVLAEAMPASGLPLPTVQPRQLESHSLEANCSWRQTLDCVEVNGVTYFEKGESSRRK